MVAKLFRPIAETWPKYILLTGAGGEALPVIVRWKITHQMRGLSDNRHVEMTKP